MPTGGKGYLEITQSIETADIAAVRREFNTLTCAHCNAVVVLNPLRKRDREWCRRCDAYVCDNRVCVTDCNPIQQGIELAFKHTDLPEQAFLARGKEGEILFDLKLRDQERRY